MDNNTDFDEELIPMNFQPKKIGIFTKIMMKISEVIQRLVWDVYYKEKYPFYLACRNTFVFLRKHKVDHMFQKNTPLNDCVYSMIFFMTFVIITIKGFFVKLKLADKAEFYLDNYKEINEGFVFGTGHTMKDHIKY